MICDSALKACVFREKNFAHAAGAEGREDAVAAREQGVRHAGEESTRIEDQRAGEGAKWRLANARPDPDFK